MGNTSMLDWTDPAIYRRLRKAQVFGEPVQVLCTAVDVDGQFEHDYHDIQLPDGQVVHAVSGFHLDVIA